MPFRILSVLLLLMGYLLVHPVHAAHALAVSPVLFDFELAPGTSKQGSITVVNDTERSDVFRLEVQNFVALGEDGAQEYLDEDRPTGLASWISADRPSIRLEPGQSADFPFVVSVPANAEPGGHYATIFFSQAPNAASTSGVGIGGKVGVLILVKVPGDVQEGATIESFTLRGPAVRDRLPVYFDLRVRNMGSVHFRPRGSLVVRNIFGQVVHDADANYKNSAVLPNSVRRVESVWARTLEEPPSQGFWDDVQNEWRNFAIGRYTASASVTYGSKAAVLTTPTLAFWVIPWRLLLLALGAIVLLLVLVKGYNRLLVRSALKKERQRSR